MILEAFATYLWLYEPLALQKEEAARELMAEFGGRWVREEDRHLLAEAICTHQGDADIIGMYGFEIAVVECRYQTTCGEEMVRPIWHEPIVGAYTTAETVAENLAWDCPEMLLPDVLNAERPDMEHDG